jgi:hypothetical protein
MGKLAQELLPASAYRAKQTTLWADVMDRIAGAITPRDLDDLLAWLDFHELQVPAGWWNEIHPLIEARREELRSEEVGQILLWRFDFL